jgi:hypothetical protein
LKQSLFDENIFLNSTRRHKKFVEALRLVFSNGLFGSGFGRGCGC